MILELKESSQKAIYKQYKQVRDSGETNMLDYARVYAIATRDGHLRLKDYIFYTGLEGWGDFLKNYPKLIEKFEG